MAMEISPLGEREYTGIANATRMLAKELLSDNTVEVRFVMGRNEVPVSIVEKLLQLSGGDILWWLAKRVGGNIDFQRDFNRPIVGLYPSTKSHRRLFPYEVLIVHDITTIVTPQYHTEESVIFWQRHLLPDMLSSDLLVAVSDATASDIRTYCTQVDHVPCIVVPEASCGQKVLTLPERDAVESFVVVLGTLEPRKNVEIVFRMLEECPALLVDNVFVFVGRWGWGPRIPELLDRYHLKEAVNAGRMVFTGFVVDETRDRLLAQAKAVLYPSSYEGFGLPVLEAMAYGTPVVTTYSTSLPEVGGNLAYYFDANSQTSLHAALGAALVSNDQPNCDVVRARRVAWAAQFTWTRTYQAIRDASFAAHETKGPQRR